ALAKALKNLPGALDQLGLTAQEARDVRRLLGQKPAPRAGREPVRVHYPIRGVIRMASPDETRRRGAWALNSVDVLVSRRGGGELFARLPWGRDQGYGEAILEVDDPANVKAVQEELRTRGLYSQSAI